MGTNGTLADMVTAALADAESAPPAEDAFPLLGPGSVQWMTAGSGILHQEMPKGDSRGRMHGFQLWANLPSALKMTKPRYQEVKAADIPEIKDDDGFFDRIESGAAAFEHTPSGSGGIADAVEMGFDHVVGDGPGTAVYDQNGISWHFQSLQGVAGDSLAGGKVKVRGGRFSKSARRGALRCREGCSGPSTPQKLHFVKSLLRSA